MDYQTAKHLASLSHPELLIDDSPDTMRHLLVRKVEGGPHYNIMLPESTAAVPQTPDQERDMLVSALDQAAKILPE